MYLEDFLASDIHVKEAFLNHYYEIAEKSVI